MKPAVLECNRPHNRAQAVQRGVDILRTGGLVVFPTETVYGVGACALVGQGIVKLRKVKNRPDDQPFTVHMGRPEDVHLYADPSTDATLDRLVRKLMPGPLTIIAQVSRQVMENRLAALGVDWDQRTLLYHQETIGLRCPDHPVARELLSAVPGPVVASSANIAGGVEPTDAASAAAGMGDRIDLVLDGGRCQYSKASTIVKLADGVATVVRQGVYDQEYIDRILRRRLLFLCSGNTCRSPMAQVIASAMLAEEPAGAGRPEVACESAGAFAMDDSPMSEEAELALQTLGYTVPRHQSRLLTPRMIREADAVFCMTETHRRAALEISPESVDKIMMLDPRGSEIPDPIGAGLDVYQECARGMRELIAVRLNELGLKPRN